MYDVRRWADKLLAEGTLGYTLVAGRPFGPFYLGWHAPVYLGPLPEPLVARVARMWLGAFPAFLREKGIPPALAEALREELRKRAEVEHA